MDRRPSQLRGVAAASFAEADGIPLWASYPSRAADLSRAELETTSIRGSEGGPLDGQGFEEPRARLPTSTVYVQIEGANHAYFGDYGPKEGGSEPTISREEATAEIFVGNCHLTEWVRSDNGTRGSADGSRPRSRYCILAIWG